MELEEGSKKNKTNKQNITQPFQRQRQSSVLCWLLPLRKIPVYADRYFFFSFSCNWTLQTTGCSSPAETQAYTRDCAAKSKGVSWPFRLAVTGAPSCGQEITLMLFHPSPLSLLLPISMGAESGTNICSPLQSITYIEYKEKQKLPLSSGIGSIYKLARIGKGGSSLQGELQRPSQ